MAITSSNEQLTKAITLVTSSQDFIAPELSKMEMTVMQIAEAIIRGDYAEGDFLPSESELGTRYGVSRSVVREAISQLSAVGLVESRRGIGTYIKPAARWHLLDPILLRAFIDSGNLPAISRELVQMRSIIEIESARIAAQQMQNNQLDLLQQWLERMEMSLVDDPATFAHADNAYHNVIITSTQNRFFIQIKNSLAYPIVTTMRVTSQTGGVEGRTEGLNWHRQVFDAIQQQNPQAASDAMRGHMEQLESEYKRVMLHLGVSNK